MAVSSVTGFEAGDLTLDGSSAGGAVTLTGTAAYSTAQARTGARSIRCNPASGASGSLNTGNPDNYIHFGLYIATLPSVARRIAGSSGAMNLVLNPGGTLTVFNNVTNVGTSATALTTGVWYWIGYRTLSGTGVACLQINGTTEVTGNPSGSATDSLGCNGTEASAIDIYIDDVIATNGATGLLGPSKIIDLLPTADSAIGTGWTLGSGGTSNLFDAVNNQPPTAVADAGTTAQIRNATSNAAVNYDATLQTYTVGGVAASSTILTVQNIIATAAPVVTSAKLGKVGNVSNPAITTIALASGGTAAAFWSGVAGGTYPTGWKVSLGTLTASPSVTLGTAPVMRVTQDTASTRIAMVAYMALRVAWTPPVVAAADMPYTNPYPPLLAQ